jgi:MFS family permease
MRRIQLFTYENALLLMLGATFGIVFFDRGAVNILMPFIVRELHLSNTQVGLVGSALALTWSLSNIVSGRLSDTLGRRKPLLIAAVVVFSLCSFVSGLATSFVMLIGARMFMGLAEGPVPPLTVALLAEASSPKRRGLNGGIMLAFNPLLAGMLGPIVLIALAQAYSWREAFYIAGIPGLVAAFILWKFVHERGARVATPVPAATLNPSAAVAADQPLMSVGQIIRTRNVWLSALICSCVMAAFALDGIFLPLYYVNVRHISATHLSWILSALGFMALPVLCLVPALSDRIGRKPVIACCFLFGLIGPLATLFFHGPLIGLALLLMTATVMAGAAPLVIMAIPSESLPIRSVGTAVGIIPGIGELVGSFGAPALGGWVADKTSLAAPFMIEIACLATACFATLFLKETIGARATAMPFGTAALAHATASEGEGPTSP